ncbi:hypothetical protein V6N11_055089 [Hibiscus sabdariffa]|uniref:Uncharacterized protein n=1 Tax=Hibiscus sabdariffa TaxID=183260 RepID=A0ABR1ZPZ5_9ROSI
MLKTFNEMHPPRPDRYGVVAAAAIRKQAAKPSKRTKRRLNLYTDRYEKAKCIQGPSVLTSIKKKGQQTPPPLEHYLVFIDETWFRPWVYSPGDPVCVVFIPLLPTPTHSFEQKSDFQRTGTS